VLAVYFTCVAIAAVFPMTAFTAFAGIAGFIAFAGIAGFIAFAGIASFNVFAGFSAVTAGLLDRASVNICAFVGVSGFHGFLAFGSFSFRQSVFRNEVVGSKTTRTSQRTTRPKVNGKRDLTPLKKTLKNPLCNA
jgi:hypothetical protein